MIDSTICNSAFADRGEEAPGNIRRLEQINNIFNNERGSTGPENRDNVNCDINMISNIMSNMNLSLNANSNILLLVSSGTSPIRVPSRVT